MNSNWNAYRMFYYVAYCGTTSAAATELHIAQPAVSHGIKQLEEVFGCKLFKRSSHGMELTELGSLLYEHIADAVSEIENAERLLEAEVKSDNTAIKIGISDITLQHFLIPYLEIYKQLQPDAEFTIRHGKNANEISTLFTEKKIDFAILHDSAADEGNYESIPVKEIRDVVFYSAKFADCVTERCLTPKDLERYPLVLHEEGCVMRDNEEKYFAEHGVKIKPEYEFSLNQSIIQQVKRKFALSIMYPFVIAEDVERGSLIEIPLDPPLPPRYFYLIRPKRHQRKPDNKFIDFILESKNSQFS